MKQQHLFYVDGKIFGLPKPLKAGGNTRFKNKNHYPHVHNVIIGGNNYWKVHIKRQNKSKIKYFKTIKEAKLFVEMLRNNKYL